MSRSSKSASWLIRIGGILFILFSGIVAVVGLLYARWTSPVDADSREMVTFSVSAGEGSSSIGARLHEAGLIHNALLFKYFLVKDDLATKIQAGEFDLSASMDLSQITKALTRAKFEQVSVTLLEGWRQEEVAQALEKSLTEQGVDFDQDTFLALPSVKEGYLFPDTYFLPLQTNETAIAATIEANFEQKIASIQDLVDESPYTLDQILTMASIIEREARVDRPIVAGILWKRLENDWPLQADATLQYAKGYSRVSNEWWTPPLAIDKEIDSPYNTYANTGLPPAPIANPSLDSIKASADPVETQYWFYITDNDGNMHYGVTYDDHLVNINRYLR